MKDLSDILGGVRDVRTEFVYAAQREVHLRRELGLNPKGRIRGVMHLYANPPGYNVYDDEGKLIDTCGGRGREDSPVDTARVDFDNTYASRVTLWSSPATCSEFVDATIAWENHEHEKATATDVDQPDLEP